MYWQKACLRCSPPLLGISIAELNKPSLASTTSLLKLIVSPKLESNVSLKESDAWPAEAIRFYASNLVEVRDIRIINSPQCHLKFDNSKGIKVNKNTISSPENSPNTDGIHLQNTQDVEIQHSQIGAGDDCVSIQTCCSNTHVHHIKCGPQHGIRV